MQFHQAFTVLLAAATMMVVHAQDCFDSLNDLQDAIDSRTDFSEIQTYKLCADTTYAVLDPIQPRRNTRIICGDDGASSDSCVLSGGGLQVFLSSFVIAVFDLEPITDVEISGLTFTDAFVAGVLSAVDGPVTFTDCIFTDFTTGIPFIGPFAIEPEPKSGQTTAEYTSEVIKSLEGDRRSLQLNDDPTRRSEINFDRCVFENNSCPAEAEFDTYAVIDFVSTVQDTTITQTVFRNNSLVGCGANQYSIINVPAGSTLNMANTCFIDNAVDDLYPVFAVAESGMGEWDNIFSDGDLEDDQCTLAFIQEANICIGSSSTECLSDETPEDDSRECGFLLWLLSVLVSIITLGFVDIC